MNLNEYQPHSRLRRRTGSSTPVARHAGHDADRQEPGPAGKQRAALRDRRAPVALRCVSIPPASHTSHRARVTPSP
jgi:hypothetical protein